MMKIYTALLVLFLSFTGCNSNSSPTVLATVWIEGAQGGPYQNSILFEVRDNKTVREITNGVRYDFITNQIYTAEESKTEVFKLSSADAARINELIHKIGGKEAKEINPINDITAIYGILNGKIYWATFSNDGDKDLLEMANILLTLT